METKQPQLTRLSDILQERGMSLYGLSKLLNAPQSTVRYWFGGGQPTLPWLKRICEVLECKSSDILTF